MHDLIQGPRGLLWDPPVPSELESLLTNVFGSTASGQEAQELARRPVGDELRPIVAFMIQKQVALYHGVTSRSVRTVCAFRTPPYCGNRRGGNCGWVRACLHPRLMFSRFGV